MKYIRSVNAVKFVPGQGMEDKIEFGKSLIATGVASVNGNDVPSYSVVKNGDYIVTDGSGKRFPMDAETFESMYIEDK